MTKEIKELVTKFLGVVDQFPEVKYVGDPLLRQPAEEATIEEGIEIGNKLGEILLRYRKAVGYGRGFAAPQIGINKAVFVTFVDDRLEIFINPKILKRSKKQTFIKNFV